MGIIVYPTGDLWPVPYYSRLKLSELSFAISRVTHNKGNLLLAMGISKHLHL